MAGKTWHRFGGAARPLYQLGNWMAGKTRSHSGMLMVAIVPTGELDGRQD